MPAAVSVVVVGSSPLGDDDPVLDTARGLAARLGGRYDIVVPSAGVPAGPLERDPVYLHRFAAPDRLRYLAAARRVVDRVSPAAGAVLMSSDPLAAVAVELSSARRRLPHLFQLQGEVVRPGPEYGSRLKRYTLGAATRAALRRATGVRVVSDGLRAAVAPFATGPVAAIGSRVDTSRFRPDAKACGCTVLIAGNLLPVKNHAVVCRAWPGVLEQVPAARLVIAGDGPLKPPVGDGSIVLAGRVPPHEMPALLASARCLAHPSWSEGRPRAVLEAMACGVPVLCSDIPAHREIVTPATGRLLPPGDPAAWTAAIVALLRDPDGAAAMGRAARDDVVKRFEQEANLDRYAEFIRRLAGT
ncbi:glycosyltransferase family 4 protein [Dactylosporangium sp. NPDC051541]|uniref:glycosyltransferase family 4 protein n=1 Tax=Dactylosporangium sp. NPDC051541 TaxID=3363977 RepID=UPI0037BCB0B8